MQLIRNQSFYLFITALVIVLIYMLAPILTPFLLGALLAYLADPIVRRFDRWRIPHLLSVILVFVFLLSLFLFAILALLPLIQKQVVVLVELIPPFVAWLQATVLPVIRDTVGVDEIVNIDTIKSALPNTVSKASWILGAVVKSGYTIVLWTANLVLTPVVTFYLLRDWNRILQSLRKLLPRSIEPTIVKLAKQSDEVLGAFLRGQFIVMIVLGLIYGIGLSLIGLRVGLVIGLIGGLLSVVPYLGSIFVLVASLLTALFQFGTWDSIIWVLVIYLIGQAIEGYVLTPYLIGDRIGLHSVAVIFATLAGGSLFGFFGVLIALPAAAVLMVVLRYLTQQYYSSALYKVK